MYPLYVALTIQLMIAIVGAVIAKVKQRSTVFWFLAILICPMPFGLILPFLPKKNRDGEMQTEPATHSSLTPKFTPTLPETPSSPMASEAKPSNDVASQQAQNQYWYYIDIKDNDRQTGPLNFYAVKKALQETRIQKDTYVWHSPLADWTKIEDHPQYKELFDAKAALENPTTEENSQSLDMPQPEA